MEGDTEATEERSKLQTLFASLLPGHFKTIWLDVARTLGPVLIVSAIVIFSALHFVRPAPPSTLTLASGAPGTKFNLVAHQYQKILARNGITLKIIATEGSVDNLNRMLAADTSVDIALVQSGLADSGDTGDLISLGSVFYVPLTIFYRSPTAMDRLSQLAGRRIAIGPPGSGTRALALACSRPMRLTQTVGRSCLIWKGRRPGQPFWGSRLTPYS